MGYDQWSDPHKKWLREAVADGVPNRYLIMQFPDRSPAAVLSKVKYVLHCKFINDRRAELGNNEDPPIDNADYIAACLSNQEQDKRFQDAMRIALATGLEQMPIPVAPHGEFRPSHFDRQSGVSFGRSPALCCAELGAL